MGKSGYMDKLQKQYEKKMYDMRLFTLQYAMDAAVIALHEEFGVGAERARRFCLAYMKYIHEISALINEDGKTDKGAEYARAKIDEKLQSIMGEYFAPWEIRYNFKD